MIKSLLWQAITRAIRVMPERLRLAFLEQPLIVPLDYADLKIVAHGPIEYYVRAKSAGKEPDTLRWIADMPSDAVCVDVGANVGTYSLIAARMHQDCRVLAVEPAAMNYASLCQNIALNDLSDRITTMPIILADKTGLGRFNYSSFEHGAALHTTYLPGYEYRDITPQFSRLVPGYLDCDENTLRVLTYQLDELIELLRFPKPTHLKIDVDGGEMDVLKGALHTIGYCQSMMIELSDAVKDLEAVRLLQQYGLQFHSKRQCQPNGKYAQYWNFRMDRK